MKHAVGLRALAHQQFEPGRGAREHVRYVAYIEHNALRFSGSAGGVNNRDRIRIGQRRRLCTDSCCLARRRRGENFLEQHQVGHGPGQCRTQISLQGGVTATDDCRLRITNHGRQFGGRLPRVERYNDDAIGHCRQVQSDPLDAVRRQQCAAVPLAEPGRGKKRASRRHEFEQLTAAHRDASFRPHLLEHHASRRIRETFKNILQKIHCGILTTL